MASAVYNEWGSEGGGEERFGLFLSISVLLHVALALFALGLSGFGDAGRYTPPPAYSVRLLSPSELAAKKPAPDKPKAPAKVEKPAPKVKAPPPKQKPEKPAPQLKKSAAIPPKTKKPEMTVKKKGAPEVSPAQQEAKLKDFLSSLKEEAKDERASQAAQELARRLDEEREEAASDAADRIRNMEFANFTAEIQNTVKSLWKRPPGIEDSSTLVTEVRMRIARDGRVLEYRVERPSGNRLFDESVLRALAKTGSVGRPPYGYPEEFVLRFRDAELSKTG